MEILLGIRDALFLILSFDPELYGIITLSVAVSGVAVGTAAVVGVPLGTLIALHPFPGRRVVETLLYTFMGLPPVVAGLVIFLLLSRAGPLGFLDLLFTPAAMVLAQVVLALPIITGLTMVAVSTEHVRVRETAMTLGAGPGQVFWTVMREARRGIAGAVTAGLGRVMAEVGAVMLVGGNIAGHTRVMTTAIVLETQRGNFRLAIALGTILLVLAFIANLLLHRLQGGAR